MRGDRERERERWSEILRPACRNIQIREVVSVSWTIGAQRGITSALLPYPSELALIDQRGI